jgi:hypothetical protein
VEVFTLTFAGHLSTDYAYDDDRPKTLQERIELAAATTPGRPGSSWTRWCRPLVARVGEGDDVGEAVDR